MATISGLPAKERPASKPTRSMPHPLRDPQGSDARRQVKQGEPFDPEELSRRLARLLAEQKSTAELRRDARAAKAAEVAAAQQNAGYHHVPKVAAAAFARTATPDVTRQIHELSRPALKQHLEGLRLKESHPQVTSLQRAQAMDQAMLEREMLSNRNQFQWTRAMEEAAEVDIERRVYKPPRRSFIPEFAHLRDRPERSIQRPLSTGDFFLEEDEPQALKRAKSSRAPAYDGRNDWAQEEDGRDGRPTIEEPASPALKKRDSIWILKGRREKPGRPDKDEAVVGIGRPRLRPRLQAAALTDNTTSPAQQQLGRQLQTKQVLWLLLETSSSLYIPSDPLIRPRELRPAIDGLSRKRSG